MQIAIELLVAQAGHIQGADFWKGNQPVPIDGNGRIDFDLSPHTNHQLVARPDDVTSRHGNAIEGSKGRGDFIKKLPGIDVERMPNCIGNKELESRNDPSVAEAPSRASED